MQPLDAVVEQVVATPPAGHAERLIVRSRGSRRVREIPAGAIAGVEPAAGRLFLDPRGPGRARRAARSGGAATLAGLSWLAPRAARAGVEVARDLTAGTVFLVRLVATGALLAGRGAYAAGVRGHAAVEARRRDRRSQLAQ